MSKLIGASIVGSAVVAIWFVLWRITSGVEGWFGANQGAADFLMWAIILSIVFFFGSLSLAGLGLASRTFIVKIKDDERPVSTIRVLTTSDERKQPIIEGQVVRTLPESTATSLTVSTRTRRRVAR